MTVTKRKATTSKLDWLLYAKGYFGLARIGVLELLNPAHVRDKNSFDHSWTHESKLPLIAILWSIKHGLEISLKGLNISIEGHYEKHHDIILLGRELRKALKPYGVDGDNRAIELARLVEKYYYCRFWNNKITTSTSILDIKNDLFRYPENEAKCMVDRTVFKQASMWEIAELQQDLNRIERIFYVIDNQVRKKKVGII